MGSKRAMKEKSLSQIKQKLAGTLARNKAIKFRWEHTPKEERCGLLAEMGRQYKITRERIRQIVNRKDSDQTYLEKPQNQRQGSLLTKLIDYLLRR